MADIQKLLRKRKLTGREAGQLELANIGDLYRRALAGDYSGPPLVDRMEERLETLETQEQYEIYLGYAAAGRWIRSRASIGAANRVAVESDTEILTLLALEAIAAENIEQYTAPLPPEDREKITDAVKAFSLEAYLAEEPNDTSPPNYKLSHMKYAEGTRREVKKDYYYLQGLNKQIDLLMDRANVQELESFKIDMAPLEARIDRYNELTETLRATIERNTAQDDETKAWKLLLAETIFPRLDYSELQTPAEIVKEAKSFVRDFSAFRAKQTIFSNMMCYMSEEEGGIGS